MVRAADERRDFDVRRIQLMRGLERLDGLPQVLRVDALSPVRHCGAARRLKVCCGTARCRRCDLPTFLSRCTTGAEQSYAQHDDSKRCERQAPMRELKNQLH